MNVMKLYNFKTHIICVSEKLKLGSKNDWKTDKVNDYYTYGLIRRSSIIQENYNYITKELPPDRREPLEYEESIQAGLHLNSFYLHLWGWIDNLAWIVASEKGYPMNKPYAISLFPDKSKKKNSLRKRIQEKFPIFETILHEFIKIFQNSS